jgi:hypothetical protein
MIDVSCLALSVVVFGVGAPAAPHIAEVAILPGDRLMRNLGEVIAGKAIDVSFDVVSGLDVPWSLPNVDVSCSSCVEVMARPKRLDPGTHAEIVVRIRPDARVGSHLWQVAFHGGDRHAIRIQINGIVPGISLTPKRLQMGSIAEGSIARHVVKVRLHGRGRIIAVRPRFEQAGVDVQAVAAPIDDAWSMQVRIDALRLIEPIPRAISLEVSVLQENGLVDTHHVNLELFGRIVVNSTARHPSVLVLGAIEIGQCATGHVDIDVAPSTDAHATCDLPGSVVTVGPVVDGQSEVEVRWMPLGNLHGIHEGQLIVRQGTDPRDWTRVPVVGIVIHPVVRP